MSRKLNEKQLAAVEYLAAPNMSGMTNDEIAEAVGVNRATFYRWKQQDAFQKAVQKAVIRNVHDRLGDIYEAAIDAVIDEKNAAMFRTILQSAGMLTEKVEVESKQAGVDIDGMRAEIE